MPDAGPTYLYRFFDGANRLLYVGISVSVLTRMDEHRHQSWWFVDARRIEFEPFPTRRDALKAERAARHDRKGATPMTLTLTLRHDQALAMALHQLRAWA